MSNFFESETTANEDFNNRKVHSLWVEKYRPVALNRYATDPELKKTFATYIEQNDIPHLLLYGTPGCGKSTLAGILVKNIRCDYIYINASDENGIDTIRDKVKSFVETASINDLKIVILDEFDFMTVNAQSALRNMMETYSETSRFILTANYVDKIIDPIKSRCQVYNLGFPSKDFVTKYMQFILNKESVQYTSDVLSRFIDKSYPDIRKLINAIQKNSMRGSLTYDPKISISENVQDIILSILKTSGNKVDRLRKIRQVIVNEGITDFIGLYKVLYDNVEFYANGKDNEIIVILAEMEYQYNFVVDKEINFSACIVKILNII